MGFSGSARPRAAAAYGRGDGAHGLVLADDALVQLALQVAELLDLALHHLGHRHAGPRGDDPRRSRRRSPAPAGRPRSFAPRSRPRRRAPAATRLGITEKRSSEARARSPSARGALFLALGLVELGLQVLHAVDGVLLVEPAGLLDVSFSWTSAISWRRAHKRSAEASSVSFMSACSSILHLRELALRLVDLHRHGVELHAQADAASSTRSMALSGRKRSAM